MEERIGYLKYLVNVHLFEVLILIVVEERIGSAKKVLGRIISMGTVLILIVVEERIGYKETGELFNCLAFEGLNPYCSGRKNRM